MYVCVYVCEYAHILCVCVCVCMCALICGLSCVCEIVCVCVCVYEHMCVCVCVCVNGHVCVCEEHVMHKKLIFFFKHWMNTFCTNCSSKKYATGTGNNHHCTKQRVGNVDAQKLPCQHAYTYTHTYTCARTHTHLLERVTTLPQLSPLLSLVTLTRTTFHYKQC